MTSFQKSSRPRRRRREASQANDGPINIFIYGYFALAILLGGASAPASIWSFILHLVSAGIVLLLVFTRGSGTTHLPPTLGVLVVALCSLALIQLLPLPAELWTQLPGRNLAAEGYHLLTLPKPMLPLSLDPQGSIASIIGLLPGFCAAALLLTPKSPPLFGVSATIVAGAAASLFLGIAQLQVGPDSYLYLHEFTNRDLAVGFFANANHLATLLLASIPLSAALINRSSAGAFFGRRGAAALPIGIAMAASVGIYLAGSVAGALLLLPTLGASMLLLYPIRSATFLVVWLVVVLCGLGALAAWSYGALILPTSFGTENLDRLGMAQNSIEAIRAYWPAGSGLGSFTQVYPLFEDPSSITRRYANHAHNDYLELILETGLPGAILIALFLGWWLHNTFKAWTKDIVAELVWMRASTIVIGVVLAHSLVDYPLRTPAILVVFVFCCVVLAGMRRETEKED